MVFTNAWSIKVWIIQETAVASELIVPSRDSQVPWSSLLDLHLLLSCLNLKHRLEGIHQLTSFSVRLLQWWEATELVSYRKWEEGRIRQSLGIVFMG